MSFTEQDRPAQQGELTDVVITPQMGAYIRDEASGPAYRGNVPRRRQPHETVLVISSQMIEAGVAAWHAWEQAEDCWPENLVKSVFRAMIEGRFGDPGRTLLSVRTTPEKIVVRDPAIRLG